MRMIVRALVVPVLLGMTMWLAGCGHYYCTKGFGNTTCSSGGGGGKTSGGGGNSAGSAYLLVADAGGIQGEVLDAPAGTIKITPNFGTVSVSTNVPGSWMAIAQEKFMYTAYPTIAEIYGWSIGGDGTLATLSGSPFPAPYLLGNVSSASQAMITDPAGTLLFVADELNEQVDVYQIGTAGSLTGPTTVQLPSGFQPYNLATDGLGKYLYISDTIGSATSQLAAYSIGSNGTLAAVTGSPFQAMPFRQMQGEASGKYMIATSGGFTGDQHLYVLSVNQSTGALTSVGGSPFATQDVPVTVAVQPNAGGTLVYSFASDTNNGVIEGFQIDLTTGTLAAVSGSPFSVSGINGGFNQSGKFLFVVESTNSTASALDAFDVSASPTLTTPIASVGWAPGAWQATDLP